MSGRHVDTTRVLARTGPGQDALAQDVPGRRRPGPVRRVVGSVGYVLVIVVLIALVRSLVVQTFIIPSGSMENTLAEGDRVAVTMYDVGDLQRGSIIVFNDPDHWLNVPEATGLQATVQDVLVTIRMLPRNPGHHLIKRVIGLPGDHVVADGQGNLTVNGVAVHEPYLKPGSSASRIAFDVVVPPDCLWVMGDNRDYSADSRVHQNDAHGGCVPTSEVVGVAKAVVWPYSRWDWLQDGTQAFAKVPDPS